MPLNDLAWDPSYVDPTDRPADGLLARFVGGRVGPLALENGARLTFPWKRQQEITGADPATIYTYDYPTKEYMELLGPTITPSGTQASMYFAGWDDGSNSIGLKGGGGELYLASGQVYVVGQFATDDLTVNDDLTVTGDLIVGGSASITGAISGASLTASGSVSALTVSASGTVSGATVTTGQATMTSSGTGTFNGLITGNAGIDVVGGPVTLASNDDVTLIAADDVTIQAGGSAGSIAIVASGTGAATFAADSVGGTAQIQGGIANVLSQTGTSTVQAETNALLRGRTGTASVIGATGANITATTGDVNTTATAGAVNIGVASGQYLRLNTGNQRTVTVNDYPAVAVRDREGAMFGTAPAITAATAGWKIQSGRQTVAFSAGAGTLTLLSSFGTGFVNAVCCAESNDTVIAVNPGGGVNAGSVALTAFTAGAAVTGNVIVSYFALGWG